MTKKPGFNLESGFFVFASLTERQGAV